MGSYLIRRMMLAIPSMVGVSIMVFFAVRFLPGSIVDQVSQGNIDKVTRQRLENYYHLHDNPVSQYGTWAIGVLHGDFGESLVGGRSIGKDLRTRLPVTAELAAIALLISILVAVPTGTLSALKPESPIDHICRSFAVLCIAIPSFWLGLLSITYGFAWFKWVPPLKYHSLFSDPSSNLAIIAAPAAILGASLCGSVMRLVRSSVLEVVHHDYVRTARAKGLSDRAVVSRHVLRNALVPVITIVGVQIPVLLGGSIVLESIFSLPGMGSYLLGALSQRDYPTVQAVVMISAAVVIAVNLLVDLVYSSVDPRIRHAV